MEDTIFTKIIKGEIPCYKIAENEEFFAFLDISPIAQGHTSEGRPPRPWGRSGARWRI